MQRSSIRDDHRFFSVLQTSERLQSAMMTLQPGQSSGQAGNEHQESEQLLLVLEGEVEAEIGAERATLQAGDVVIVPRRAEHRFRNTGSVPAVTFNVYGPPAY